MSLEADPDLALVRRLHLELNGSGRRTRGVVQPPVKKIKRETAPSASLEVKQTSSQSGSDSRSGKAGRRDGTLKRLIKRCEVDSRSNLARDDDTITIQTGRKEVLEPQVSTKIASGSNKLHQAADGDVGSRSAYDASDLTAMVMENYDNRAAALARMAAERDGSSTGARVKCFCEGVAYGISIDSAECSTRQALEAALKDLLPETQHPALAGQVHMFVYNTEGRKTWCRAEQSDDLWNEALQSAKRIYLTSTSQLQVS